MPDSMLVERSGSMPGVPHNRANNLTTKRRYDTPESENEGHIEPPKKNDSYHERDMSKDAYFQVLTVLGKRFL